MKSLLKLSRDSRDSRLKSPVPVRTFIVLYKGEYPVRFIAGGHYKIPTYEIVTEPEATHFTDELEAARIAARHEMDQYRITPVMPPIHLRPVTQTPSNN